MPKYIPPSEDLEDLDYDFNSKGPRGRMPEAHHVPKKKQSQVLEEIVEATGLEGGFNTTYQPAQYEKVWLLSSLRVFYDEHLISDVLAMVKGGKEASVYRCQAVSHTGLDLVAAKVYRPQMFRNLRNDKMYREGRQILTGEGRIVKRTDHRIMRAIGKKTAFGEQVQHSSWLLYEYTTLLKLHQAGAAVPQPHAVGDNAIIMDYIGDSRRSAPTLNEIKLDGRQARQLFQEVLRNIELMMQQGFVHGDLSAYNMLYWDERLTLIDFPQVTDIRTNRNARFILQRDIMRVCEYFSRQGVRCNADAITEDLWQRYGSSEEEGELLEELA
ncbi:MAG TPA: RIO1 family regulatory kinase/ATPase [Chloroflexia bacterium]|nr:RIO1 family regulatory kinase/ATPase [Chloroflexia bacterium]